MDAIVVDVFIVSLTLLAATAAYTLWSRSRRIDRAMDWFRNAAIGATLGATALTMVATAVGESDSRNFRTAQAVNEALARERSRVVEEGARAAGERARAAAEHGAFAVNH